MPTYDQIGDFSFLRIEGEPQSARYQLVDTTRPAAPGVAFRRMRRRPPPFIVRSLCLVATQEEGGDAEALFANIVGTITGIVYGGPDFRFFDDILILDHHCIAQRMTINNVGGVYIDGTPAPLNGSAGWLVESEWQMIYGGEVAE